MQRSDRLHCAVGRGSAAQPGPPRGAALLACLLVASGCGGRESGDEPADSRSSSPEVQTEQLERALVTPEAPAELPDPNGGAWRLIEVPALGAIPVVIPTPSGWLSLSRRSLGSGKVVEGNESALYHSTDGVHWRLVPIAGDDDLLLRGVAYGNGRYVIVGGRGSSGLSGVVLTSSDGEHWDERPHRLG